MDPTGELTGEQQRALVEAGTKLAHGVAKILHAKGVPGAAEVEALTEDEDTFASAVQQTLLPFLSRSQVKGMVESSVSSDIGQALLDKALDDTPGIIDEIGNAAATLWTDCEDGGCE